jgi:hypothetical protein
MFKRWRRLDSPGLEVLSLHEHVDGITARSVIIDSGDKPFGMTADWRLDSSWRSRSLLLHITDAAAITRQLEIVRTGPASWQIDGTARADLDGCAEIDVSATPFCNGLALRHLGEKPGELTALYVLAPDLTVQPSRQRYEKLENGWRYVDLGAAAGFTAILTLDYHLIVRDYEGLFETLDSEESHRCRLLDPPSAE